MLKKKCFIERRIVRRRKSSQICQRRSVKIIDKVQGEFKNENDMHVLEKCKCSAEFKDKRQQP